MDLEGYERIDDALQGAMPPVEPSRRFNAVRQVYLEPKPKAGEYVRFLEVSGAAGAVSFRAILNALDAVGLLAAEDEVPRNGPGPRLRVLNFSTVPHTHSTTHSVLFEDINARPRQHS